ncbi:TetR/AcrR family transcriptional regulator [Chondromyces apiculatus]|uniref:Transcriptional regulator, TetR family n=1 Tax=Chondromyces apiculatus DSM 436 TaxID=1192034 RepID=A0A017T7F4_9BACT|nr:TetR/AcrR family transcriptional regulator [Chondromyces apiculatus]EYF04735.1 Transcriptional regulator, TetR family [Chondromyces apiculatus DSM 436]
MSSALPGDTSGDDRRSRILAVARQHFERYGYKRTVIDDIVAEVGIAKGSLYLEFPSKESLFFAVLDASRVRIKQRFAAATQDARSSVAWLRAMLRFTFASLDEEPLMVKLLVEDPDFKVMKRFARQDAKVTEADAALEHLRGILRDGIAAGEIRPDLDLEVTPFVLGALKFLHLHTSLATLDRIDRSRLVDGLIDLVIAGIEARPGDRTQGETPG